VIEATEEAILNALCAARDMDGVNGNLSKALPIGEVKGMVAPWQRQVEGRRRAAAAAKKAPPARAPAAESERREAGPALTTALALPTAARGAEGMALPARLPPSPGAARPDQPAEAEEHRPEAVSKQD
jgi:D-aminopeptidase